MAPDHPEANHQPSRENNHQGPSTGRGRGRGHRRNGNFACPCPKCVPGGGDPGASSSRSAPVNDNVLEQIFPASMSLDQMEAEFMRAVQGPPLAVAPLQAIPPPPLPPQQIEPFNLHANLVHQHGMCSPVLGIPVPQQQQPPPQPVVPGKRRRAHQELDEEEEAWRRDRLTRNLTGRVQGLRIDDGNDDGGKRNDGPGGVNQIRLFGKTIIVDGPVPIVEEKEEEDGVADSGGPAEVEGPVDLNKEYPPPAPGPADEVDDPEPTPPPTNSDE